jgi:hypothetical protein
MLKDVPSLICISLVFPGLNILYPFDRWSHLKALAGLGNQTSEIIPFGDSILLVTYVGLAAQTNSFPIPVVRATG